MSSHGFCYCLLSLLSKFMTGTLRKIVMGEPVGRALTPYVGPESSTGGTLWLWQPLPLTSSSPQ